MKNIMQRSIMTLISQKNGIREFAHILYIILIHHFPISLCSRIIDGLVRSEEYYFFPSVPPFSNYPSTPGREPPCCCGTPRNREPPVLPASIVPRYVVSVLLSGPMYTSYMCSRAPSTRWWYIPATCPIMYYWESSNQFLVFDFQASQQAWRI